MKRWETKSRILGCKISSFIWKSNNFLMLEAQLGPAWRQSYMHQVLETIGFGTIHVLRNHDLDFVTPSPLWLLSVLNVIKNCHFLILWLRNTYHISARSFRGNFFFWICKSLKMPIVSTLIVLLCTENLNSFLTSERKLFKGGNYSREETIHRNTVFKIIKIFEIWKGPSIFRFL